MVDVIAAHSVAIRRIAPDRKWQWACTCGAVRVTLGTLKADHAAHLAEELTKAGYRDVQQDAKAKALREAAKELASIAYVVPGGAGRAEYESRLAVRRGDTDKWLHTRADLIDALADPEGHALVKAIHDRKAEG